MPKIIALILLILILLSCDKTPVNVKTIYILPLGDSITQGGKIDMEEYTYRFPLFCMLKDAGVNFDFIGCFITFNAGCITPFLVCH